MEQWICDICKKNLADMSFKVKRSNKRWGGLWSGYEDIDVCNECGKKLLGIVNYNTIAPVHPPSSSSSVHVNTPVPSYRPTMPPPDWLPPLSVNCPQPSYTPPTPPKKEDANYEQR